MPEYSDYIEGLSAANPLDGSEIIGLSQTGSAKRATAQQIANLAPGSSGTVTTFSAGNLSPLFTSSVATATTTPALTFALVNQSANMVYAGPSTGVAAAPTFRSLVAADIPSLSAVYLPLSGGSLSGNLNLPNNGVLDVPSSGGSDVLNIGTGNAEVINIGRTGATVNIIGTTVYENVTELQVSDKLITINKGGSAASATGTGFEIEENSAITGYFKTNAGRTGYDLKAPATAGIATFITDATSRTYTLPAGTGTLALTSDLTAYAPLSSPTFTGTPAAPTAAQGTNTTQIATTAFVVTEIAAKAWLLTGTSTLTGAATITNNTASGLIFNGTINPTTASNQFFASFGGSVTTRATVSDVFAAYLFNPSLAAAGTTNQNISAVKINPTWTTTNAPNNVCLWITVGSGDTGALPLYIETTAGARLFQFNSAASLAIGSTGTASIGAQTSGSNSATGRGPILATTVSSSNTVGFMFAQNSTNINGLSGTNKWIRSAAFTYNPTTNTGSPTLAVFEMSPTINQTSTATGPITYYELKPVLTSVLGVSTVFLYDPSVTTVSGAEYGIVLNRGVLNSWNAGLTPTAIMHIGIGSATVAQTKYNSTTILTTAVAGVHEYNGSWYKTKASGLRFGIPGDIFEAYADTGNTTTTETDLHSYTTPANAFGNNGEKIASEYGGLFVSSATATRQIKVYFAGTVIFDTGALTLSLSSAWTCFVTIIRVSSTVVRYMVSLATEGAALSAYTNVGELTGLTLSNTNILKITGQAAGVGAATNDIVLKLAAGGFAPVSAN
jgi:hypothetical protein